MKSVGTLVLLCGLPGSGKSTLAKRMEAERDAILFSPDRWIEHILADPLDVAERDRLRDPIENLQWDLAQSYLQKGLTVILDNGFWTEEERTLYAMAALELGARIELHYLEASHDELWRRVQLRNEQMEVKTFEMTREEVECAWALFEPPTAYELAFYDESSLS